MKIKFAKSEKKSNFAFPIDNMSRGKHMLGSYNG